MASPHDTTHAATPATTHESPTMRLNRRLVPIVLIGAILFVGANAWMALSSVRRLESSRGWVDHTWQVIAQVEEIMGSAKDAESSSRGYLLSGDEKVLAPLHAAEHDLPGELTAFKQLTLDNPSQ